MFATFMRSNFVSHHSSTQSEVLDVPVSVETAHPDQSADFYNLQSKVDYAPSTFQNLELATAANVGDCRTIKSDDPQTYEPCAHFVLEEWLGDRNHEVDGIEPPFDLGALGDSRWFVPKFTAKKDPTLVSYLGLSGEETREAL